MSARTPGAASRPTPVPALSGPLALRGLRWVVLDEVHYLQNAYRGPVWEEVIIHAPQDIGLVASQDTIRTGCPRREARLLENSSSASLREGGIRLHSKIERHEPPRNLGSAGDPGDHGEITGEVAAIAPQAIAARKIEVCTFFIAFDLHFYAGSNAGHRVRPRITYGDRSGLSTHFARERT